MPQLFIIVLGMLSWIPAVLSGVTTVEELAILEGKSLTVPCRYEPQYANNVKYWCRGGMREFCTSLARTDDPRSVNSSEDKVGIFDDPSQLVFTVTMKDLKEDDSGWYMCGVEIGSGWNVDDVAFSYIKVIHGMSVVNSRVSGEEGSSVTAQCLYSERYRESEKKWCRSGDWSSCLLTGSDSSYEDASVAISDDRTGTFSVTLKKLQMRDAGWYLCSAGQQQIAVHVLVTPRTSTTTAAAAAAAVSVTSQATLSQSVAYLLLPKPITSDSCKSQILTLESLMVCAAIMVIVGSAIFARKMWKLHKQNAELRQTLEMKACLSEFTGDDGGLQNSTVVFLNSNSEKAQIV